MILVIAAIISPTELSVYLGGMRLSQHRLVFLLVLPLALLRLIRRPDIKIHAFDIAFLLYNVWTVSIFMYHGDSNLTAASGSNSGSQGALSYGGSLALEGLGGYIITRAYVRDWASCAAVIRLLFAAVALVGLFALPETITNKHLIHDFASSLTGYLFPLKYETRMGLERAYSTFDHPIHYGTFCASILAMVYFTERELAKRWRKCLMIGFATILGLSSAPMLCIFLQLGLIVWDQVTRGVTGRLKMTLGAIFAVYVASSMLFNRSLAAFVATGMTLDPWTGYYRLEIWAAGRENVMGAPFTGIGLADWVRPWWMIADSIDAFWLVIPLRAGLPAVGLLLAAILLLLRAVATKIKRHPDPEAYRFALGWSMSVIALSLCGVTVHYWNSPYAYLFVVLGLGGWLADPMPGRARAKSAAVPVDRAMAPPASPRRRSGPTPRPRPAYQSLRPRVA